MSTSIEYRTILACFDKLVTALRSDPVTISNNLLSENLIPPLPGPVSAQKIAELLLDKIKVTPKRYHDVINVFSRHDWLKDIVEILQSESRKIIERDGPKKQDGLLPRGPFLTHQDFYKLRECPMYKAPPCFSRSLEDLLSNRFCYRTEFPDWKKFADYFHINVPIGEKGVVKYWVHDHCDRELHTIQLVLDFAEKKGHSPLAHKFEKLIEDHKNVEPTHVCRENSAECFQHCPVCKLIRRPSSDLPTSSTATDPHRSLPPSPPDTPHTPHELQPGEVVHILAPSLFEKEYPYKLFMGNYWILEPIIVLFLAFQTLSSIYITLCEEGGAHAVFHGGLNMTAFINRVVTFSLRILARVIAPFVFYRQLCSMSEAEKALQTKKKREDYVLAPANPVPYRHRVTLWSIISHSVIFSLILLYLGAFLVAEDRLRERSICIKEIFRFPMPILGIRLVVFFDCLSCFFILMLVGLVKDCYCLENRLSTSTDQPDYFDAMRKRWYRIDWFCYTVPVAMTLFSITSLYFGGFITPVPDHRLDEGELETWCFWMIALSLLLFFGSASNWTAKIVTVVGNLLALCCAIFFTIVLGVDKATFPPGSFSVLFYCHISMSTINLVYCLMKAHNRVKGIKSKRFWLSLTFLILLTLSLFAIVIREVVSLAVFMT